MPEALEAREWTTAELERLENTPLIRVAPERPDRTLRPFVTIGHVRVGGDELVRSLNGVGGSWYRAAMETGRGAIDVGGLSVMVIFTPDHGREDDVDQALRHRYGDDSGVRRMMSSPARDATFRITPQA